MQLNEYLAFLLKNDLISLRQQQRQQPSHNHPSFMITEKGTHFLSIYNQMNEMIGPIQTNKWIDIAQYTV